MTFLGGTTNTKRKWTERRQEEEREGCMDGKSGDGHGAQTGESRGGGERGGTTVINGKNVNSANLKARV